MTSNVGEKKKKTSFKYSIFVRSIFKNVLGGIRDEKFPLIALETLCFVSLSDQVNAEMRCKCQISFSP